MNRYLSKPDVPARGAVAAGLSRIRLVSLWMLLAVQALVGTAAYAQAAPTVFRILRIDSSPTNGSAIRFTVEFTDQVVGVSTTSFVLATTGTATGTISSVSGSGTTYTTTISGVTGDGTLRLDVKNNSGIRSSADVPMTAGYSSGEAYTLDHTGPAVGSVGVPADAVYVAGNTLDFTVNFNEAVTVDTTGGTPAISLVLDSSSQFANYLYGSGSSSLAFRYTVVNGDLDANGISIGAALALRGGTVRDAVGNNATVTLNSVGALSGVLVNAGATAPSAPVLTTATPGDGQVTVSWTAPNANGSPITGYTVTGAPSGSCTTTATTCVLGGLANGVLHSFTVTAANIGGTSQPSGALGATPVKTQASGSVPGMAGAATVQMSGGSSTCTLASSNFNTSAPAGAPANSTRPAGVFGFRATGCPGDQLTVTLNYPDPLPSGVRFFKYGPPAALQPAVWFELAGAAVNLSVDRRTVSYTVRDNQSGDSDAALGVIEDPFAPMLVAAAVPTGTSAIPTLSHAGLAMMSALLTLSAWRRRRPA